MANTPYKSPAFFFHTFHSRVVAPVPAAKHPAAKFSVWVAYDQLELAILQFLVLYSCYQVFGWCYFERMHYLTDRALQQQHTRPNA